MDNRGSLLFFILVFYFLLNSQVRPPLIDHDREHQRQLAAEKQALRQLNTSNYGDFDPFNDRWLPFPGLRKNDSYLWELLPTVQATARRHLGSALETAGIPNARTLMSFDESIKLNLTQVRLPVYRNVTGKLKGDWVRRRHVESAATPRPLFNITALVLERPINLAVSYPYRTLRCQVIYSMFPITFSSSLCPIRLAGDRTLHRYFSRGPHYLMVHRQWHSLHRSANTSCTFNSIL
jgi:hypothetical protein